MTSHLFAADLDARRPVWLALSDLFLDTSLDDKDRDRIAQVLAASPYSIEQLHDILLWEVYPACHTNMYSIAGEWSGFDPQWLEERIRKGFWLPHRLWTGTVGRLSVCSSSSWRLIKERLQIARGDAAVAVRLSASRTRRRRIVLAVLATAVLGSGFQAFIREPRQLVVREVAMGFRCWSGPPLRIAIASDLHVGSPGVSIEKLDAVVSEINASRPDLVLLLGDYVIQGVIGGRFVAPEAIADRLRALKAPLGVFGVLGNHDWWLDGPRVARAFNAAGIPVLEDRAVRIARGMDAFWLVGIGDFWEGRHDVASALSQVKGEEAAIAMTHNPDIFPEIPARVCLTVAGHAHGGQVDLPFLGRLVVPSRYGSRYAAGEVDEGGRRLFVTTGIGTSILPVRFGVVPEVVILTMSGPR